MIFFIFGILALLAAFCLFRSEYKAAAMIPGALAVVLIVISCVSFVPTGYTGIVTTFGKVENGTKDAGVVVKAPWQSIVKMDNRVQEVSIDLSAFSSDIQEVATSVTVGYRINQANAMTIYKEVGRKYEDVLILPRVPEVVKAVVAHYDASSLISNRDAVAEQMDAQLRSVLAQYNSDHPSHGISSFLCAMRWQWLLFYLLPPLEGTVSSDRSGRGRCFPRPHRWEACHPTVHLRR